MLAMEATAMRLRLLPALLAAATLLCSCGGGTATLPALGALPTLDANGNLTIPPEIQNEYAALEAGTNLDVDPSSVNMRRAGMYWRLNHGLYSEWQYIGLGLSPRDLSLHKSQVNAFAASIGGRVDTVYTDDTVQGFTITLPYALSMQRCAQVGDFAFAIFGDDLQSLPDQTWDLNLPGTTSI
jgi:hypothetical protein